MLPMGVVPISWTRVWMSPRSSMSKSWWAVPVFFQNTCEVLSSLMRRYAIALPEFAAHFHREHATMIWIYLIFFLSGFPALVYQLVWQRALFTIYGVNIESITVVVAAFMVGLGLGSLLGGVVSRTRRFPLPVAFGLVEFGIGAYGFGSLALFDRAAELTAGVSHSADVHLLLRACRCAHRAHGGDASHPGRLPGSPIKERRSVGRRALLRKHPGRRRRMSGCRGLAVCRVRQVGRRKHGRGFQRPDWRRRLAVLRHRSRRKQTDN